MRLLKRTLFVCIVALTATARIQAQNAQAKPETRPPLISCAGTISSVAVSDLPNPASNEQQLAAVIEEIEALRKEQAAVKGTVQDEDTKKRMVLMQKQIDTLEKMVKLLAEQVRQPASGAGVEKLQMETSTLQARSVQAAQRDRCHDGEPCSSSHHLSLRRLASRLVTSNPR